MKKVFLYMTMTFDGFFAGPHGELDWMSQTPDQELTDDMVAFFQGIDRGFIGYPTASGMIPYWGRTCDRAGSEHLTPSHSLAPGRTT